MYFHTFRNVCARSYPSQAFSLPALFNSHIPSHLTHNGDVTVGQKNVLAMPYIPAKLLYTFLFACQGSAPVYLGLFYSEQLGLKRDQIGILAAIGKKDKTHILSTGELI